MLDNTAKLSDIISALQGIEGINAKADLASVVGSPATASDTMAAINAVIQQAKNDLAIKMGDGSSGAEPLQALIDKLFVGKKWASGTITSSSSNKPFTFWSNGQSYSNNIPYATISNLLFTPSVFFIKSVDSDFNLLYSDFIGQRIGPINKLGQAGNVYPLPQASIQIGETCVVPAAVNNQSLAWFAIE